FEHRTAMPEAFIGLSMTWGKHLNVEAALALARGLNEYTRFYAKPMRGHGNVTGATCGINIPGTVSRMDGVPIPLRPASELPYPSDEQVLRAIEKRVRELQREFVEGISCS
ncbi:MAG TPA: hypothetical protein VIL46_04130, partial [Gemmataceae bacterium]